MIIDSRRQQLATISVLNSPVEINKASANTVVVYELGTQLELHDPADRISCGANGDRCVRRYATQV